FRSPDHPGASHAHVRLLPPAGPQVRAGPVRVCLGPCRRTVVRSRQPDPTRCPRSPALVGGAEAPRTLGSPRRVASEAGGGGIGDGGGRGEGPRPDRAGGAPAAAAG